VCRRSARSSGQWVGHRRLCGRYMAGTETKPKTPNTRSGQHCRTESDVRKKGSLTYSNPYSNLSLCLGL
jgi:hypothetical protein